MRAKAGFPPIAGKTSQILILGTMPGEESLRKNEYYANPRNSFWKIMASLFGFDSAARYEVRKSVLLENRIALWDVIKSCERAGSLDSSITPETIILNDFASFFKRYPNIRNVFFNGAKAENLYFKRVLPKLSEIKFEMTHDRLPSTSPAMAQLSFTAKMAEWSRIKKTMTGQPRPIDDRAE